MADIELMIKLPEEDYRTIKNRSVVGDLTIPYVFDAIRNGKRLPKGHGDIGDFDEALKCIEETSDCDIKFYAIALIEWAMKKRVIIESDKEIELENN